MKTVFYLLLAFLLPDLIFSQGEWKKFELIEAGSLRGISALSADICWVSGAKGKVFLSTNAGELWLDVSPPQMDTLDFRDIHAFDAQTAIIMSAGYPTRVLKTSDAGANWQIVFTSDDPQVFLDAMDFWNPQDGLLFGDAIGQHLMVLKTEDAGETWQQIDTAVLPRVAENQGGFAASGSCLVTFGQGTALIGLGGPEATVLRTEDYGLSWQKSLAPLTAGAASRGIFSFYFTDSQNGWCAGGDYRGDTTGVKSLARTSDGGKSWQLIAPSTIDDHYYSAVLSVDEQTVVAMSRFGSAWSFDGGESWQQRKRQGYFSLSKIPNGFWASGPDGKVARWLAP